MGSSSLALSLTICFSILTTTSAAPTATPQLHLMPNRNPPLPSTRPTPTTLANTSLLGQQSLHVIPDTDPLGWGQVSEIGGRKKEEHANQSKTIRASKYYLRGSTPQPNPMNITTFVTDEEWAMIPNFDELSAQYEVMHQIPIIFSNQEFLIQ